MGEQGDKMINPQTFLVTLECAGVVIMVIDWQTGDDHFPNGSWQTKLLFGGKLAGTLPLAPVGRARAS